MSSTSVVETQVKTQTQTKNHAKNSSTSNNNNKKKNKFDRSCRKRSKSFSGGGIGKMKSLKPVLPTKFLLGGNINDPLNLNSLQDEEINRAMNAVTPKSSPIPTPPRRKGQIEVIIPQNIHDPLRLIDCADDAEYEKQLLSPVKKSRKKRLKKRRTVSATMELSEVDVSANSEARTPENNSDSAKIPEVLDTSNCKPDASDLSLELSPKKDKPQKRKSEDHKEPVKKLRHSMDKIVSPVIPQPGAWLKRTNMAGRRHQTRPQKSVTEEIPQFKEKNKQFQYGNYNRYYGYRNPHNEVDHRLKVFAQHQYLFRDKDILDIGCNIGHVTLSVARDFGAKSVTGIDIDNKLIGIARKNVKHYVKSIGTPRPDEPDCTATVVNNCTIKSSEFFPISMPILYGPIDIPGFNDTPKGRGFPNNVTFKQCNYVLEDDNLLSLEQPVFDTILCLSVTKWIHLNWGDNGIKQAFRRMYAQLKPGGKLVLEAQNWASYKGKRKLTENIFKNYSEIEFFPDKFTEYLLSPAVGFAKSEMLAYPHHHSKGFRRPIQVFTKSTMFPSERIEATPRPNAGASQDSLYQSNLKTRKYDAQTNEVVEHVYTSLFDRYCGSSADVFEATSTEKDDLIEKLQTGDESNASVIQDDGISTNVRDDSPLSMEVDNRLGFDESQPSTEENSNLELEIKENTSADICDVLNGVSESLKSAHSKDNNSGDNT